MTTFFTSENGLSVCQMEAHCNTCRMRHAGQPWRVNILRIFDDVQDSEFTCPKGKPFIEDAPSLTYAEVCTRIDAAPNEGLWVDLKHERNVHANAIEMFAKHHTPCWKNRQRNRVVEMYMEVMKKINKGNAS